MPVTFKVAEHNAKPVELSVDDACRNADQLLARSWRRQSTRSSNGELLQSSLPLPGSFSDLQPDPSPKPSTKQQSIQSTMSGTLRKEKGSPEPPRLQSDPIMKAQSNGFVDTVMQAYNQHHRLILRPDDVWIAILGQFNFYVNANAEKLRSQFVSHKGKKKLVVYAVGDRYSVDFGDLAHQMTGLIDQNVVDKELKSWILPDFSTTSHNDTVVCSVLMMATLKAYFSYGMSLCCGIPSVTLEGEKKDWEKLLSRIDKLSSFGAEPAAWAKLLRPILKRFVSAFDGKPDIEFWGKVCRHVEGDSGPGSISGWITAFCVWNSEGKWQGPALSGPLLDSSVGYDGEYRLILDDVQYAVLDDDAIPVGFCEVDVELDDNGNIFNCMMVSGHMGTRIQGKERDTVKPLPAWFMFIKSESS